MWFSKITTYARAQIDCLADVNNSALLILELI
jgi:hypothetical protein